MAEYYEKTSKIVNGYWYSFEYHNGKETVPGYDKFPFIYCIGPSTTNLNCFVGLNLHHLPLTIRMAFLVRFDELSHFRESDIRYVYTEDFIVKDLGVGLGIKNAVRYYNKKNILNPYRIHNKAVPLFVEYDGDIIMKDPSYIMNKYLRDLGENNK